MKALKRLVACGLWLVGSTSGSNRPQATSHKLFLALFLAVTAIWAQSGAQPQAHTLAPALPATQKQAVPRNAMTAVEKAFDLQVNKASLDDPYDLLGTTRGVYLEGYGVVFTAEVNLVMAGAITPFHQEYTKEELAHLRQKKLVRLDAIKQMMMEQLVSAATSLDTLPKDEQIVLGVILLYRPFEDISGLPHQLLMQAPRKALLASQKAAIRVQVF